MKTGCTPNRLAIAFATGGLIALLTGVASGDVNAQEDNSGPMLPHVGLELTTAFTNSYGPDAESFFKFKSVTAEAIIIDYSSTRGVATTRNILIRDRQSSNTYVLGFANSMPDTIPGTTSLGISSASLMELRSNGQAILALAYDANLNKIDGQLMVADQKVKVPLLIENETIEVPAIHATGNCGQVKETATATIALFGGDSLSS